MMSQSYAPIEFWADYLFNKKELIWVPFRCGFGGIGYYADTAVKVNFISYSFVNKEIQMDTPLYQLIGLMYPLTTFQSKIVAEK